MGDEVKHSADNKVHIIVNKGHTGVQHTGNTLDITAETLQKEKQSFGTNLIPENAYYAYMKLTYY
jgi:molybdopterin biosynthesis enzyme MoaB